MSSDVKTNIFWILWVNNTICTENKLEQDPFLGFGHNWAPKPVGVKCHQMSKESIFSKSGG